MIYCVTGEFEKSRLIKRSYNKNAESVFAVCQRVHSRRYRPTSIAFAYVRFIVTDVIGMSVN